MPVIYNRKNVFIINDIDLVVPPTNIDIRKEDLVYSWRTLRTNVATKIPTGHGQIQIHVTIPFTNDMMLDLHRLIVEFKHSPFCYIDNRFLRESIVPDWPYTQNMAFTMNSMSVSPAPGTSDTWMVELDLSWFNYFPYTMNFLFRKEWNTNWVKLPGGSDQGESVYEKYSIGWKLDEVGNKTVRRSVVARSTDSNVQAVQPWDALKQGYSDQEYKTIFDLEKFHSGQVFDTLPIPDNMEASRIALQPRDSNVYIRYINMLQRDALLKNFGIDVEQDLKDYDRANRPPPASGEAVVSWYNAVFNVDRVTADGKGKTIPLNDHRIPLELQQRWVGGSISDGYIAGGMLPHNRGITFRFNAYKSAKLPANLTETMGNTQDSILRRYMTENGHLSPKDGVLVVKNWDGTVAETIPYRVGYYRPEGKHIPVKRHDGSPMPISEFRELIQHGVGVRSTIEVQDIYGGNPEKGRAHRGIDITVPDGTPVCAIEDSVVSRVYDVYSDNAGGWVRVNLKDKSRYNVSPSDQEYSPELNELIRRQYPGKDMSSPSIPVGTYFRSSSSPHLYFVKQFTSAGRHVVLRSVADNSESKYLHLSEIYVSYDGLPGLDGPVIPAGTIIGLSGSSSWVDPTRFTEYIKGTDPTSPIYEEDYNETLVDDAPPQAKYDPSAIYEEHGWVVDEDKLYITSPHLHFEYHENTRLGDLEPNAAPADRGDDGQIAGDLGGNERSAAARSVRLQSGPTMLTIVDPMPSYEAAADQSLEYITLEEDPDSLPDPEVLRDLKDEGKITEKDGEYLRRAIDELMAEGWRYYDADPGISNVFEKTFIVTLNARNGLDNFIEDNLVFTNVGGMLQHITSSIPILGQEYPTQQHLGSIEPKYTFEFHSVDNVVVVGDNDRSLEGISESAQILEMMRSLLQFNARKFRPVVDSWCVSIDTFMTRLLGTYRQDDFWMFPNNEEYDERELPLVEAIKQRLEDNQDKRVEDWDLKKRAVITRGASGTIEGSPGTTYMVLEADETNPYQEQVLRRSVEGFEDVEEIRRVILQKLEKLDVEDKYKEALLPALLVQEARKRAASTATTYGNTDKPESEEFGSIGFFEQVNMSAFSSGRVIYGFTEADRFIAIDAEHSEDTEELLRSLGYHLSRERRVRVADAPPDATSSTIEETDVALHSPDEMLLVVREGEGSPSLDWLSSGTNIDHAGVPSVTRVGDEYIFTISDGRFDSEAERIQTLGHLPYQGVRVNDLDLSEVLKDNLDVGEADLSRLMDLYRILNATKKTAEFILAEHQDEVRKDSKGKMDGSGARKEAIDELLYGLDIEPSMWRYWQVYQQSYSLWWARRTFLGLLAGAPTSAPMISPTILEENPGWLEWERDLDPRKAASFRSTIVFPTFDEQAYSFLDIIGGVPFSLATSNLFSGAEALFTKSTMFSIRDRVHMQGLENLADHYVKKTVPVDKYLEEIIKRYGYENTLGRLIGEGATSRGRVLDINSMHAPFVLNAYSSGHWQNLITTAAGAFTFPYFVPEAQGKTYRFNKQGEDEFEGDSFGTQTKMEEFVNAHTNPIGDLWGTTVWPGREPGSPMVWRTTEHEEFSKIRYIRRILIRLADDIRSNIPLLRLFGLEHLAMHERRDIVGTQAYPDLELPYHPYYGDLSGVGPDFYMWNMHDDGGVFSEVLEIEIQESLDGIIDSCAGTLDRLKEGISTDRNAQNSPVVFGPEVDDIQPIGPVTISVEADEDSISPYDDSDRAKKIEDRFVKRAKSVWGLSSKNSVEIYKGETGSQPAGGVSTGDERFFSLTKHPTVASLRMQLGKLDIDPKQLTETKVRNIAVSVTDIPGGGGETMYPAKITPDQYSRLSNQIEQMEGKMFGSREGYLDLNTPEGTALRDRLEGTKAEYVDEFAHRFDSKSLKHMAKDASADMRSRKFMMRAAYPTFKLFFVEEDEFENRFLNFDDFYSYNGVKSFTVEMSSRRAADSAIITIQNVSGTLDGSNRNVVSDADYFNEAEIHNKVDPDHNSNRGGSQQYRDTERDQPFGAVVLRPGLNVQLRAGFDNDPDNLHVLISGRVIDVSWNKTGDLAEVMIQSFGAELEQVIKGTQRLGSGETFYTTHQLLGSLMLSPEIRHFGRWEFGQKFQPKESTDHRFDFHEYGREGYLGRFTIADKTLRFMYRHKMKVAIGLLVLEAMSLLTPGKVSGFMTKGLRSFSKSTGKFIDSSVILRNLRRFSGAGVASSLARRYVFRDIFPRRPALRAGAGLRKAIADEKAVVDLSRVDLAKLKKQVVEETRMLAGSHQVNQAVIDEVERKVANILLPAPNSPVRSPVSVTPGSNKHWWVPRFPGAPTPDPPALNLKPRTGPAGSLPLSKILDLLDDLDAIQVAAGRKILAGRYGVIPGQDLTWKYLGSAGMVASGRLTMGIPFRAGKLAAIVTGFGAVLDVWRMMLSHAVEWALPYQVTRARKFFSARAAQLMLSPQDDNLFPPHPKDYMALGRGFLEVYAQDGAFRALGRQAHRLFSGAVSMAADYIVPGSGDVVSRFLGGELSELIYGSKLMDPKMARYQIVSSSVWGVFYEMSLRHPGWIFGPRPYGNKFEYRMFFGIPSQRYWSKPAGLFFHDRIQRLYKYLHSNKGDVSYNISDEEYEALYGDLWEDGRTLDQLRSDMIEAALQEFEGWSHESWPALIPDVSSPYDYLGGSHIGGGGRDLSRDDAAAVVDRRMHAMKTARAIKEYLRGLELRFVPFRRYHMITSDRDIIWNGLVSSEQATANAVNVTYFDWRSTDTSAAMPVGAELFKAHTFIPEHQLRVLPMRPYKNCKGYASAMRYGMGQLMHELRNMYRGEILVRGNPRIRPWDICLLQDGYNNMVGPVEVEQVVHNFSHETGFITEIKPSAVVFGNEVSGWPMLEAMKLFSVAMRDIEEKYWGVFGENERYFDSVSRAKARTGMMGSSEGTPVSWLEGLGDNELKDFMALEAGELRGRTGDHPFDKIFRDQIANDPNLEALLGTVHDGARAGIKVGAWTSIGIGAAALGTAALIRRAGAFRAAGTSKGIEGQVARALEGPISKGVSRWSSMILNSRRVPNEIGFASGSSIATAAAGIAGLGLGVGGLAMASKMQMPSIAWMIAGPILLLQCMRKEAVIVVPLMKDGQPIVSGLSYHDPNMVWSNLKGKIRRFADDTIGGTRDAYDLYERYGTELWRQWRDLEKL